jgi:hypothetical protein
MYVAQDLSRQCGDSDILRLILAPGQTVNPHGVREEQSLRERMLARQLCRAIAKRLRPAIWVFHVRQAYHGRHYRPQQTVGTSRATGILFLTNLHMPVQTLTPEILAAALQGLGAQRQRVESQIADVRRMLGGGPAAVPGVRGPRRKRSAAVRRKMAEAQRRRWAARKEPQQAQAPAKAATAPAPPARKRKMSAAGRKAIIEATKKRWAEFRKAQKQAAAKKSAPRSAKAKRVPTTVAVKASKKAIANVGGKHLKAQTAAPSQAAPALPSAK